MAEPLTPNWQDIETRIQAAPRVLIACDFDGTLSPIVPHPDDAAILPECLNALRQLTELPHFHVAILSGRGLDDVRARVGLANATYSGNHGMEIAAEGMTILDDSSEQARIIMSSHREEIVRATRIYEGVFVEDKGVSLSVHYRAAPEELEPHIERTVRAVTAGAVQNGVISVVQGKKVLDIRAADTRDKGAALSYVARTLQSAADAEYLPIYVGDDSTDEDAFQEVNRTGGISILVGPAERDTVAAYRVDSPYDVADFLRRLTAMGA